MSGRLLFPDERYRRTPTEVSPRPLVPFAIPFDAGVGCPIVRLVDVEISITGVSVFSEPEDLTDVIYFRVTDVNGQREAAFSIAWLSKMYPAIAELQVHLLLSPNDRVEIVSPKSRAFGVLHGVARGRGWTPSPLRSP